MNNPELYNQCNQVQLHGVEKYFDFYREKLREKFSGKNIELLDIGSGCGRILSEVVIGKSGLNFSKVIGVDVSEEMVKFSQDKYGSDQVSFQVMDIVEEIPETLMDRQFDIVSSFFCLHWVSDLSAAFGNIPNLLKSDGLFCCIFSQFRKNIYGTEVNDEHSNYLLNSREDLKSSRLSGDPVDVLRRLLSEHRMEFVELVDIPDDEFEFDSIESFEQSVESLIPKEMPEAEKREIVKKQLKLTPLVEKNGKFVFYAQNVYFIARKL
ncbi:juvenile hormone acid O-methyltransferase-like [Chironomus tepperi]|uniref:juvenile hormone acid O-methyltransferase-like n=1 Tax=Chironomus tepperi TaxID=113505 RepID=UPI00391F6998